MLRNVDYGRKLHREWGLDRGEIIDSFTCHKLSAKPTAYDLSPLIFEIVFFFLPIQWSAYGPCSQTCGVAIKSRRRTCGNPQPKFGGRVCIGSDRQEIYCNNLPPCPLPTLNVQIDGSWGPFGDWSECSTACGGGFRIRQRKCDDPAPL